MALGLDLTGRAKRLPFGKGVNRVADVLEKSGKGAVVGLGMITLWNGFREITGIAVPKNIEVVGTGAVAYRTGGVLGVLGFLVGTGIYRNFLPGLGVAGFGKTKNTAPVNQVY